MKNVLVVTFILLSTFAFSAEAGSRKPHQPLNFLKEKHLPILDRWNGYYPIFLQERFEEWHATPHGGCFFEEAVFASFWGVFREGEKVPPIDFDKNMVVFVGGDGSSPPMIITKISIKDGIAEVVADRCPPGSTHEEGLPMALAEIPRAAVKLIRIGQQQIAVKPTAGE